MVQFLAGAVDDEGSAALTKGVLIQGDTGSVRKNLQTDADGKLVEASAAAILAALGGELEVVQPTAADLNVTEASAAAILAALGGELEVVQPTAADLNATEANSGAIKSAVEALATLAAGTNIERISGKYNTAQTNTVLRAVAPGKKWVTTGYEILLDADCTATAVRALLETGSTRIAEHPGIAPGSGVALTAGVAPMAIGADGDDLLFTCDLPTSGDIVVHASGYEIDA
jgi:hypothetical protein